MRNRLCAGRLVDLSGIVSFSVSGLAVVATKQQCREQDRELRVVATTRSALRALRVIGLGLSGCDL